MFGANQYGGFYPGQSSAAAAVQMHPSRAE